MNMAMIKYDYYSDFQDYCIKHLGISSMQLHYWDKLQNTLYNTSSVMTPYITEETDRRISQMSVFDRLMMDRKLWLAGPVNDQMSTVVQAQLLFLETQSSEDITMHVDTPGGSTKSGKSIIDVMNYITPDIATINTGMAASMGSVILSSGTKGKRFSLPSSKVMIHQVSAGTQGNIQDMRITIEEAEKENESLFKILSDNCNKDIKEMLMDSNRDKWFNAEEALDYGLIDKIIIKK